MQRTLPTCQRLETLAACVVQRTLPTCQRLETLAACVVQSTLPTCQRLETLAACIVQRTLSQLVQKERPTTGVDTRLHSLVCTVTCNREGCCTLPFVRAGGQEDLLGGGGGAWGLQEHMDVVLVGYCYPRQCFMGIYYVYSQCRR